MLTLDFNLNFFNWKTFEVIYQINNCSRHTCGFDYKSTWVKYE